MINLDNISQSHDVLMHTSILRSSAAKSHRNTLKSTNINMILTTRLSGSVLFTQVHKIHFTSCIICENFGNIGHGLWRSKFRSTIILNGECQQLKSSILFQHILQLNDANKPFLHIIFPDDSRWCSVFAAPRINNLHNELTC